MKCSAKNKAGKPCNAPAARGTKRCVMHSGRAAELGSKGGRRRAVYPLSDAMEIAAPRVASELVNLLAHSIVEVRTGKLDPKTANAITYLATGFLRAIEVTKNDTERKASAEGGQLQNATAFQVYEAQWLRNKKAQWDAELEKKHADKFPQSEGSREVGLAASVHGSLNPPILRLPLAKLRGG
jgi:hypothetical protein